MKRGEVDVEPELNSFIQARKIVRHMPPDMRARVLARARVIVASGGEVRPALLPDPPLRHPARAARSWYLTPAAVAASATLAVGAFAGIATLRGQRSHVPEVVPLPAASVAAPPSGGAVHSRPARDEETATIVAPRAATRVRIARAGRSTPAVDPLAAEVELLQMAHGAYSRQDFGTALKLIVDHAQRFPRGALAEQREALRVRSLASSGRSEEARRAAIAFAEKFPRSVLLSAVENAAP